MTILFLLALIEAEVVYASPKPSLFLRDIYFFSLCHRSGTEEEYSEMEQLLDDVLPLYEQKEDEKEKSAAAKKKEESDRAAGLRMRENALRTLSHKRKSDDPVADPLPADHIAEEEAGPSDLTSPSPSKKKRTNVKDIIKERTDQRKKELELRERELKLQEKRQEAEQEERRALIAFLKANTPK